VVGAGDLREVGVGQLAVGAVHQRAELAGVDEQGLAAPVAEVRSLSPAPLPGRGVSIALVARQEPQHTGIWVE